MAPGVVIDTTSDFDMPNARAAPASQRTLLLAPPSLASHPEALSRVAEAYDRNATDIQMLDRLALGLVALPAETYDIVLLLADVAGSRQDDALPRFDRDVMERIVASIKAGGRVKSQDGSFGRAAGAEQTEAILAGLVKDAGDGMVKPLPASNQTVSLRLGKKKANAAAVPANSVEAANTIKRKSDDISTGNGALAQANGHAAPPLKSTPAGVGFIDTNDDFDDNDGYESEDMEIPSNEELARAGQIDPNSLLSEEDLKKPLNIRTYSPSLKYNSI